MTYYFKQKNINCDFLIQISIFLALNFLFCFNINWYISTLELQNSSVDSASSIDSASSDNIKEIENDETEETDPEGMNYDEVL